MRGRETHRQARTSEEIQAEDEGMEGHEQKEKKDTLKTGKRAGIEKKERQRMSVCRDLSVLISCLLVKKKLA